jgi:protein gp37
MERGVHERVFCGSECDILEGRDDLDTPRLDLWQTIRETDWLYWLLLSKRPQNYRKALPRTMLPDPTVWLGTTVGCKSSLWRIDELRKTPASIRFLSCEPLLEDLGTSDLSGIHWVIVGGESGPGARPCHVEWIRSLVQQCKTEGVPVFVKQLGSKPERCMGINGALDLHRFAGAPIDKAYPLKLKNKKGGDPAEWPEDLRVRQFPRIEV